MPNAGKAYDAVWPDWAFCYKWASIECRDLGRYWCTFRVTGNFILTDIGQLYNAIDRIFAKIGVIFLENLTTFYIKIWSHWCGGSSVTRLDDFFLFRYYFKSFGHMLILKGWTKYSIYVKLFNIDLAVTFKLTTKINCRAQKQLNPLWPLLG